MNLFVYRKKASEGANQLADALTDTINNVRVRRYRAAQAPLEGKVLPNDIVICWGEPFSPVQRVKVLNGAPHRNKFADAVKLAEEGVATIQVSRTRPASTPTLVPSPDPAIPAAETLSNLCEEFTNIDLPNSVRSGPFTAGLLALANSVATLRTVLNRPIPVVAAAPAQEWLARTYDHVGGDDLLNRPSEPDFYALKENLVEEFRVHSFCGRSIRAGKKIPREGMQAHGWVRSWDGGWRISYDGISSTKAIRQLAHKAVAALGLDFGAVDIGVKADGSLIVLEVNRAPGIQNGTIDRYVDAIQKWIRGEWQPERDSDPDRGDA